MGGYISFEFAHIVSRAGAKVTILHRSERPLKNFDPELVDMLVDASREAGIEIHLNTPVDSVEKKEGRFVVRSGQKEFQADLVVHGSGVPDIDNLDLEKGGVRFDKKGIAVNEFLQSISNPSVYAAGDAAAVGPPLTPVAAMEGRTVAKNILKGNNTKADYYAITSVVFTSPPLASVGLSESEANKRGINFKVNYQDTSGWYSSRRIGLRHSGFKVFIDKDNNKIIGAHLLGHNTEEVINVFAVAMKAGMSADEMKNIRFSYPSNSSDIWYMI